MISGGAIEFEELVQIVSKKSNISETDCLRELLHFEETIVEKLSHWKIVRFNKLGSFHVSISSDGTIMERKVTRAKIGKATINFRIGKKLKICCLN